MKKVGATSNGKLQNTIDWYTFEENGKKEIGWLFRYEENSGLKPRCIIDMEKYVSMLHWISKYKGQGVNEVTKQFILHHYGQLLRDGIESGHINAILTQKTGV